jgi:hypothetical protein
MRAGVDKLGVQILAFVLLSGFNYEAATGIYQWLTLRLFGGDPSRRLPFDLTVYAATSLLAAVAFGLIEGEIFTRYAQKLFHFARHGGPDGTPGVTPRKGHGGASHVHVYGQPPDPAGGYTGL